MLVLGNVLANGMNAGASWSFLGTSDSTPPLSWLT